MNLRYVWYSYAILYMKELTGKKFIQSKKMNERKKWFRIHIY